MYTIIFLFISIHSGSHMRCTRGHCVVVSCSMAGNAAVHQYHQTGDLFTVLSVRTAQLYYEISGDCLGVRFRIPRQWAWGNVVGAFHYYAGRLCGVPIWCIRLMWPSNPWELSELSPNLRIACTVSNDFSQIDWDSMFYDRDDFCRCSCCWEDCVDTGVIGNCVECNTTLLCDRCRVQMPDGVEYCLICVVAEQDSGEDDRTYGERVDAVLSFLEPLQRRRWVSVQAICDAMDSQ